MTTMTLAVPSELKNKMENFPEINWSEIARQTFTQKIQDLEFLKKFKEKSTLTEQDALRIGKQVSKAVSDKLRKKLKIMDLVVDANIVIAVLIKEGITHSLLFREDLHLYTSEYIFEEIENHKEELLGKTKRTEQDFYKFT